MYSLVLFQPLKIDFQYLESYHIQAFMDYFFKKEFHDEIWHFGRLCNVTQLLSLYFYNFIVVTCLKIIIILVAHICTYQEHI